jgi:serine/threonine protein kinase
VSILHKLRSPLVVSIFGTVMELPESLVMLLEYAPHGSLRRVIEVQPSVVQEPLRCARTLASSLASRRCTQLLGDVAGGMAYLYAHGVQHRDLKAANVLVFDGLRAKITDFGLARSREAVSTLTRTRGSLGTPNWTAPELVEQGSEFTEACDVYSFGMVVYESITQQLPWEGLSEVQVMRQMIAENRPAVPQDARERYGERLLGLMERCWAQDPGERVPFQEAVRELAEMRPELVARVRCCLDDGL